MSFSIVRGLLLSSVLTLVLVIPTLGGINRTINPVTRASIDPWEQGIVEAVNGSRAYTYDLELENIAARHYAYRSSGSLGANETANWILTKFQSFGMEAWLEPFEFASWDLTSKPSLIVDDDGNASTASDQSSISSFQSEHYSWPTSQNGVFADLVILPLPPAANYGEIGMNPINLTAWNAVDTTGKVVLTGKEIRWDYYWQSNFVGKLFAQPPAAVVYTWWYDWMSFTPVLMSSAGGLPLGSFGSYYWDLQIPVGSVNYDDGLWIRSREEALDVSANLSIKSVLSTGTHYNVAGRIRGQVNPEKTVIISGHYDTVLCNGFCDNGAGTAGMIELAKIISDAVKSGSYVPIHTILFVAFADEELSLVGSVNYVQLHKSDMPNIKAVINLDCIGSDEFDVSVTNPVAGFDLDQIVVQAAADIGIAASLGPTGGSDQETFRNPSWANGMYSQCWGLDANISDAMPVQSSAMLGSHPTTYADQWQTGTPGWIHTEYDNSTSTATINWVELDDLQNQLKAAVLTTIRVSPNAPPSPRNIATVYVTPFKTIVGREYTMRINVTVENQGNYIEYSGVTLYANAVIIARTDVITLRNMTLVTITMTWNTTGFGYGNYTITAVAGPIANETDTADNTHVLETPVHIGVPGDVTSVTPDVYDGRVDIRDVTGLILKFNARPGDSLWNPNYDVNDDTIINVADIVIAILNFMHHE